MSLKSGCNRRILPLWLSSRPRPCTRLTLLCPLLPSILLLLSDTTTLDSSSAPDPSTGSHRRRRSSVNLPTLRLQQSSPAREIEGTSSGLSAGTFARAPLPAIPGTPAASDRSPMSLSRSPSPHPGGGWSSPGLTPASASSSPRSIYPSGSVSPSVGPSGISSWAAARAKSEEVRGYPSFSTRNNGFFSRQKRRISASLPQFQITSSPSKDYREKEKLGRGRWSAAGGGGSWGRNLVSFLGSILRRTKIRLLLVAVLGFVCYLMFWTCMCHTLLLLPPQV